MRPSVLSDSPRSELQAILAKSKGAFLHIGVITALLNVLLLSGSIYMMLVYDMVLPSRSVPTLVSLFGLLVVVYVFQVMLDLIRGRMLTHLSSTIDVGLGQKIHRLIADVARTTPRGDALQPMRDLDQVRSFLSSLAPTALFDLPWMFFFIALLFVLHPLLGLTVLVGGLVLIVMTVLTEKLSKKPLEQMTTLASSRYTLAEATRRHADVLRALGMQQRLTDRWMGASAEYRTAQTRSTGIMSTLGGISKAVRLLLQSAVLTVGALLVMDGRASGGVIFASSILSSRALAPIELVIGNWRAFGMARQSWARLRKMLDVLPDETAEHQLPAPTKSLSVERLALAPAGSRNPIVNDVSFRLQAGEACAVLGPSGCGKSTLVRGLVGVLQPVNGAVRLDGATLDQWSPDALGRFIGYLPQNVELITGTVAENIARFEPDAPSELVVAAAKLAGVHDLVLRLPDGYSTQVGNDGASLSAGQRQRIALARAMYRDPFLLVLDEPNSNLDRVGEDALADAVRAATARGAIVVLVAHRPSILAAVDLVLLMQDGRAHAFGPKEKLVPDLLGPAPTPQLAAAQS